MGFQQDKKKGKSDGKREEEKTSEIGCGSHPLSHVRVLLLGHPTRKERDYEDVVKKEGGVGRMVRKR